MANGTTTARDEVKLWESYQPGQQGKLDEVADKFFTALDKEFSTKTYKTEKEKNALIKDYKSRAEGFWKSINKQVDDKMNAKYKSKESNGTSGVEVDAIEKTIQKLNKKGEKTNYQRGETPVKVDGKVVN